MASDVSKLVNQLSVDELLDIVNKGETEEQILHPVVDKVVAFLQTFNIQPGPHRVKKQLLYKLYREWTKTPMDSRRFFMRLGKYIPYYDKAHTVYLINQDLFVIQSVVERITKKPKRLNRNPIKLNALRRFFAMHDISEGPIAIEGYILYYLYDTFLYNEDRVEVREQDFINMCYLHFKSEMRNDEPFFFVNEGTFRNFTEEKLRDIRQGRKWKNEHFKKKEKNKKKRS